MDQYEYYERLDSLQFVQEEFVYSEHKFGVDMYFTIEAFKTSYTKCVSAKLGAPFFGLLEILRVKTKRNTNRIKIADLSRSLNSRYLLADHADNTTSDETWTLVLSNQWQDQVRQIFVKEPMTISLFDLYVIINFKLRIKTSFDEFELLNYFVTEFGISAEEILQMGFDASYFPNLIPLVQQIPPTYKLVVEELGLEGDIDAKTLGFEFDLIKKLPGELSGGPYIQPLYASQKYSSILLLNRLDLLTIYDFKIPSTEKTTPIENYHAENILIAGPPGTGKTKAANYIATKVLLGEDFTRSPRDIQKLLMTESTVANSKLNFFSTQFHPSFSYEDFFEGIRPVRVVNTTGVDIQYAIVPGIFKVASQIARAYFDRNYKIKFLAQYMANDDGSPGRWILDGDAYIAHYRLSERHGIIFYEGSQVFGTNSFQSDEIKTAKNPIASGLYPVEWVCRADAAKTNFVLFIDELNRGNTSKIFGEALSLIEDRKRIGKEEMSEVMLPYSHEVFGVPPNLTIITALNSADRSLSSLDYAFKRRFKHIYLSPDFDLLKSTEATEILGQGIDPIILQALINHFKVINQALGACGITPEAHIGHSYLIELLRTSYGELKKIPNVDHRVVIEVVSKHLNQKWEEVLHSQIREIIGQNRMSEFSEAFAKEASNFTTNNQFLGLDTDQQIEKYLSDAQPAIDSFSWKKAS